MLPIVTLACERYVRVVADQLNRVAAMASRRFAPATPRTKPLSRLACVVGQRCSLVQWLA
jgi:hypothetical protein